MKPLLCLPPHPIWPVTPAFPRTVPLGPPFLASLRRSRRPRGRARCPGPQAVRRQPRHRLPRPRRRPPRRSRHSPQGRKPAGSRPEEWGARAPRQPAERAARRPAGARAPAAAGAGALPRSPGPRPAAPGPSRNPRLLQKPRSCRPSPPNRGMKPSRSQGQTHSRQPRGRWGAPRRLHLAGTFPRPRGCGGTTPTKEGGLPPAAAADEASILPEGEVSGGRTGVEDAEAEAESSAATASSVAMTGVRGGQGDPATPLRPGAAPPARREVRGRSTKKSPSGAGSGAPRPAARPTRVTWPLRTRRPPRPRTVSSPPRLRLPRPQERLPRRPQPASLLPAGGASSPPEGCPPAAAGAGAGPLRPFARAGPLQPRRWPPRSRQLGPCRVRSRRKRS